jgi:hypothetical protein
MHSAPNRLCPSVSLTKHKAFTTKEATHIVNKSEDIPSADLVVLHVTTNDLTTMSASTAANNTKEFINDIKTRMEKPKIVLSLPINRQDQILLNDKVNGFNSLIREYLDGENAISLCQNRNLGIQGCMPDSRFLARDGVHLTPHGTSRLANNMRTSIETALNIPTRQMEDRKVEYRPIKSYRGQRQDHEGYRERRIKPAPRRGWNQPRENENNSSHQRENNNNGYHYQRKWGDEYDSYSGAGYPNTGNRWNSTY